MNIREEALVALEEWQEMGRRRQWMPNLGTYRDQWVAYEDGEKVDADCVRVCPVKRAEKDTVDYGRGMKSAHCAICRHWKPPDQCEIIIGKISPQGWCNLFAKRSEK